MTLISDADETIARAAGFVVVELLEADGDEAAVVEIKQGRHLRDTCIYRVRTTDLVGGGRRYTFRKRRDDGGQCYVVDVRSDGRAVDCQCEGSRFGKRCKHLRASEFLYGGQVEKT